MNAKEAWELRVERGMLLPDIEYANERLRLIAKRMREISAEWDALDKELKAMAVAED